MTTQVSPEVAIIADGLAKWPHGWAPISASLQECPLCGQTRPIPDECDDENLYECYANGHGGGECPGSLLTARVVDIFPGTPEWDESEVALERQRRAGG